MVQYQVISVCDRTGCTYSSVSVTLDAISADAAWTAANVLNRTSDLRCPICGESLGFFPDEFDNCE
ncbi:hypothetical protein ASL14_11270 [Paenibacillus sp. IHB B 3084]|uniref:hypothetical protein n=1 Tax=unclassified Paenibacillus TaxID=185978 RepID=UPI00071EACED|nr:MULTISPECIES: hypothetical protein [unclassified Paenibacillus]ALP36650.1 hypothetical protein ASL14_11270 [Paenibacillus sp. IHB B 3084]MBE0338997.1 hypothetical protein [Paenibacillus sp. 23TSA30-6]